MAVVKLEVRQAFPAGSERLWTVFGKPDYTERKYRALGSTEVRIRRFDATAREITVELERLSPVAIDAVPQWARPFVGKRQAMRHATVWRRTGAKRIDAELEIDPVGQPVAAHGTGEVVEIDPAHSRLTLRFDVTCRIPRLGGRVAAMYASQIEAALAADHAFTLKYLREAG
jgi:hypothetical protein